jgi:nucleophosmin 3
VYFQIFLGEGVKEFEEQVVQVEVTSKFGKNVQPIAFLRQGTLEHVSVNVNFSDHPVTFSLVKGLGPVHLIGNHTYGKLTLKSGSS